MHGSMPHMRSTHWPYEIDPRVFLQKGKDCIIFPDYPFRSSFDDDPVRMGRRSCAGIGEPLGQGVELEAAVEAPSIAGKVALGMLGADVMIRAGECRLDVAQRGVDPLKRCPLGGLRAAAGDHRKMTAAGPLDRRPAAQAIAHDVAAGGEITLGQGLDLLLPESLDHRQPPACCTEVEEPIGSGAVSAHSGLSPCRTKPMPASVIISFGRSGT